MISWQKDIRLVFAERFLAIQIEQYEWLRQKQQWFCKLLQNFNSCISLYIKRGYACVRSSPSYLKCVIFAQFCASVTFWPQKVLFLLNFAHYFMLSQWYFCFVKRRWNTILPRFEGAHRAHWQASKIISVCFVERISMNLLNL